MASYGKKEAKKKKAPKTTLFEVTKKKEKIKAADKKKAAVDTSVVSESEYAPRVPACIACSVCAEHLYICHSYD